MALDSNLIRAIMREMHGRNELDEAIVAEVTERLAGLLARGRRADEQALRQVSPAFSFDPSHAAYRPPPVVGSRSWEGIVRGGGGTGYGGSRGTTGVAAPPPVERPAPVAAPDFLRWSAVELAAAIRRRDLTPTEVTRATLDRIAAIDGALHAFVTVMADEAMEEARRAEAIEPRGLLHGVPIALKDLIETRGVRTTAGSRILADYVPSRDATVVTRLREAGAIIVGKTATHEFAFGATTDSPYHGPVHNPWDLNRTPGGSSGGSAAAVSAAIVPLAMGTDTGGSIRMPASACSIVGLKPTYGRVSKAGVIPLSWSLDHVGPLTRTVQDAAVLLRVIAGSDAADPTTLPIPVEDYVAAATPGNLRGVRIGIPLGWLDGPIDPEVLACFEEGMHRLYDLGAELFEVATPPASVMTFINRLITLAEAGAYHAPFLAEQADAYAPDVRLRLELGAHISARDYLIGQRLRGELARHVQGAMQDVDALATPTMPIPPAQIGQAMWEYVGGTPQPVVEEMVRFPAPFSLTGQPAFSLPCGFTAAGLPVGLQLIGRPFGERELIRIAAAFESTGSPVFPPL